MVSQAQARPHAKTINPSFPPRRGYSVPKTAYPSGSRQRPPSEAWEGRAGRTGRAPVFGWVGGTPRPGRARGIAGDQPGREEPDGFHPGFLQHRLTWMGGPGVNALPRLPTCWVLWVPQHPTDRGADPMLTPTRGPTSPGGSLLGFQTPEKFLGLPVAPGLEEAGVLAGSPGSGFMKANWEGKNRLTLPRVCARDGREEPRFWGTSWATPKMPQPPPQPFFGVPPQKRVLQPSPTCPPEEVFAPQHPCPRAGRYQCKPRSATP